jgi:acetyl esterase/lipase
MPLTTFLRSDHLRPTGPRSLAALLAVAVCLTTVPVFGQATSSPADSPTNPMDLIKQPAPPANERITYGSDPLQFAELRLPPGKGNGPFPVAVLVHGGCWSRAIKGLPENVTSYELLRPMAAALAEAGIANWNIEYRRLGNAGGGWPGTYLDLATATDQLRKIAPRYHLDLGHVISIGHSSGGQLALWLAARPKLPKGSALHSDNPLPLKGAIDLDGPADLIAMQAMEQTACGSPVITDFLGGTPEQTPERYRDGAVAAFVPTGVRQELFVRNGADPKWKGLVEPYVSAATKAGDAIALQVQKGSSHFDAINPQSSTWEAVLAAAKSLLGVPLTSR